jgi:catechol 2,3-dioxygenase-like lactoylglutathione lyase family enzyme
VPDRSDAVDCGGGQVVFDAQLTLGGSQRTGIDHISLSYPDLTAKMAELESVGVGGAGVRLQRFEDGSTLREIPGLFLHGFIFDPWGTRIELVEDGDTLGFHHIHLSSTDPAATLAWYQTHFGVERAQLRDRVDGLRLGHAWLLAMPHGDGIPAATTGRAIEHIAFTLDDIDGDSARLSGAGVQVTQSPVIPEGGRTNARRGFVAAPDNVRVAVVEPGFAGVERPTADVVDITTQQRDYTVPRTPWGAPDFQGVWTGDAAYGIPLERPEGIGADTDVLTPEQTVRRREQGTLRVMWGYDSDWHDTTLGHVKSTPSSQVAMVIDPPDGRIPEMTPEAQERARQTRAGLPQGALAGGPEDLSNWVRCITRGMFPMPIIYNNGLQIVQGPGHVAVTTEMVHETRIIPTNPTPNLRDGVTSYRGDARGRWERDTLVVESANFNGRESFRGSTENLTLTERYTRTGPETLRYEFTLDDPTVWTRPWTGMYTFVRDDTQYELVEYACHEGNYGMTNILSGARAHETDGR